MKRTIPDSERGKKILVGTRHYTVPFHCAYTLALFCGRKKRKIPRSVITSVHLELEKSSSHNFPDWVEVNCVHGALKKLRLFKYYDHAPYICRKINPRAQSVLHRLSSTQLDAFADFTSKVYKACKSSGRPFLISSYMLGRILLLHQFVPDPSRARAFSECLAPYRERAWKDVCAALNWPYRPLRLEICEIQKRWDAAVFVQAVWRGILGRRRAKRLVIGREISLLPEIGIDYKDAKSHFDTLKQNINQIDQ